MKNTQLGNLLRGQGSRRPQRQGFLQTGAISCTVPVQGREAMAAYLMHTGLTGSQLVREALAEYVENHPIEHNRLTP